MNIRRRQDPGNREVGTAPRNTATRRVDAETQVKKIANAQAMPPKSVGVTGVKNAVNAPKP